jgi:predicted nucleotidyltransferase
MIQTEKLLIGSLGAEARRVLERLPKGTAKIFGSALRGGPCNDIDVAVRYIDQSNWSYLLYSAQSAGIHPIRLSDVVYDNLHNLLSWKNCCATADMDGVITYGHDYTASDILQFNPQSRKAFPNFSSAVKAASKMEKNGFIIPPSEKARAEFHLTDNHDSLVKIAREALTDRVVYLLAAHDAVVAGGFFRDEVDGRCPKDIDVFVPANRGWLELCEELKEELEEIEFEIPEGKRVNLRKFRARSACPGHEMLVIDVIDYGFVHEPTHVVETFDFSCNTLWWQPGRSVMHAGLGRTVDEVVSDIRNRHLIVGDNMWYRAGLYRALKRWQRFRGDGYVADAANIAKYAKYVKLFNGKV